MEAKAETKINGGRIRKVTITEVEDEAKIENKPEEKSTEEIFNEVDKMITDWKTNLEVVVGEGLKKIKKICKEKKIMIQYLPGDGTKEGTIKIKDAKSAIINECFSEVLTIVGKTHNNLNDVGQTKTVEAEQKLQPYIAKEIAVEENLKQKRETANFYEMKKMMKDLEDLYGLYNNLTYPFSKVPIYNVNADFSAKEITKGRNNFFSWFRPMATLNQLLENPRFTSMPTQEADTNFSEIMRDFINTQKPIDMIMKEWNNHNKKSVEYKRKEPMKKDLRRAKLAKKSLKNRREAGPKKFVMREFTENGEKHYILVKKPVSSKTSEKASEEIFNDWKNIFSDIKSSAYLKPRKRKISHRQERKELIKEAIHSEEQVFGPLTYSDMLKKNLKIKPDQEEAEDILESCSALFDEIRNDRENLNPTKILEDVDFFKAWRHNFHIEQPRSEDIDIIHTTTCLPSLAMFQCGKPSIISIEKEKKYDEKVVVKSKKTIQMVSNKADTEETPTEKFQVLKSNTQVIPYTERKELIKAIVTAGNVNPNPKDILEKGKNILVEDKTIPQFQPSIHSKRQIIMAADTKKTIPKEVRPIKNTRGQSECGPTKIIPQPTKKSSSWTAMITPSKEETSRGEYLQNEDIFSDWCFNLKEVSKPDIKPQIKTMKKIKTARPTMEDFFCDWLINLDGPVPKMSITLNDMCEESKRVHSTDKSSKSSGGSSSDEESVHPSKRESRQQKKVEEIDECMTEYKDNRRNDFAKNVAIKNKKRNEAARKSIGKRIK